MTTMASFHRVRGRRQHRVVEPCEGLVTTRRAHLVSGLAHPRASAHPLTQVLQCAQRGLRMAATGTQRVAVLHALTALPPMRQATGDGQEPWAFGRRQATSDAHTTLLEPLADVLVQRRALTREAARGFGCGRRSAARHRGRGGGHTCTRCGHRCHAPVRPRCDARKGTALLGHLPTNGAERCGRARRALGRAPLERHVALRQGLRHTPHQRFALLRTRIVIEDRRAQPFVRPSVDGREDARGARRACIGSDVPRHGLQCPVQPRTGPGSLRLFFPQPRPRCGGSPRAHTRGARARGASARGGRACALRPPDAPPCL